MITRILHDSIRHIPKGTVATIGGGLIAFLARIDWVAFGAGLAVILPALWNGIESIRQQRRINELEVESKRVELDAKRRELEPKPNTDTCKQVGV